MANIRDFILEFGEDFTFVDDEYRVQVGNKDFHIDLLLYNRELSCLVAIELKVTDFKPGAYSARPGCIKDGVFIDPPYNTGNDFVYEDDFAEETGEFLRRDGQYDDDGNRMVKNLDSR